MYLRVGSSPIFRSKLNLRKPYKIKVSLFFCSYENVSKCFQAFEDNAVVISKGISSFLVEKR